MKLCLSNLILASFLSVGTVFAMGCSSDTETDAANGKTISDLDIGGDVTLDKGKTQQMTATVKYADGTSTNVTTSSDLVWNIGNTDVATISKDGVVTGQGTGATTIKATYQGKSTADHTLIVH